MYTNFSSYPTVKFPTVALPTATHAPYSTISYSYLSGNPIPLYMHAVCNVKDA